MNIANITPVINVGIRNIPASAAMTNNASARNNVLEPAKTFTNQ